MDILEELNISNNSPSYDGSGALALDSLCSMMGSIASLRTLRMRNNSLTDKSAFVLADSLCIHANIVQLDLSDNPAIGSFGTFALVKLVVLNSFPFSKKIQKINLQNSFNPSTSPLTDFNFSDPSGHYALDLTCPFNRAVARQCLRHWELIEKSSIHRDAWFIQAFDDTFFDLKYNGEKYKPEKDIENVWVVPSTGNLTFTAIYRMCSLEELQDPRKFFARHISNHLPHPISDLKEVDDEMFACFLNGMYDVVKSLPQRSTLIDCVATFFKFTSAQVDRLIKHPSNTRSLRCRIAGNLLPKKTNDVLRILASHVDALEAYFRNSSQCNTSRAPTNSWFSGANPTGEYSFDLTDPQDRGMAYWMVQIDRFDVEKLKRGVATNIPSFTNIRNSRLDGLPFKYTPDWVVPSHGVWRFDYLSPHRFAVEYTDASVPKPIPDSTWNALVETTNEAIKAGQDRHVLLKAFRRLTRYTFFIDCNQLSSLLRIVDAKSRIDLVAIFLRKLVDYAELKEVLCRPRLGLEPLIDSSTIPELEKRIGQFALVNPIKMDNTTFACDLSTTEGRLIAGMVLKLMTREKGSRLVNSKIGPRPDTATTADPPKAWHSNLPRDGYWSMTYVSTEDGSGADKSLRKQMALSVCGFDPRTFNNV